MARSKSVKVVFWSKAGQSRWDARLHEATAKPAGMAFEPDGRFYAGRLAAPVEGTLVLSVFSPRPIRLWIGGAIVLDEGLFRTWFERSVTAAVVAPCPKGEVDFLVEVGSRSLWHEGMDRDCPSRNREYVRAELGRRLPDRLSLEGMVAPGVTAPAMSVRFLRAQFRRDGVTWQHVLVRPAAGFKPAAPSLDYVSPTEEPASPLLLRSTVPPCDAIEGTTDALQAAGVRRFFVPVANDRDEPAPLREPGPEKRIEPVIEIARMLSLTVEGPGGAVAVPMPGFESLGRLAPHREFRAVEFPAFDAIRDQLPEPVLPPSLDRYGKTYYEAWRMLLTLVRNPAPESGLPGAYLGTAAKGFLVHQFVWDSSFTAMATAYGWRVLPAYATLDLLYSRQFDGGYLHREHDVRDGMPAACEPDFSPNPPITAVAEWAIASLTGDRLRLARVYGPLAAQHRWIAANRRLADGTYWTTGLANGLDNSPSLGDGYPCLTAQMAHDADILGRMARVLGFDAEADAWRREHDEIGQALNEKLWSEATQIYATSLAGGGHNPNKVVTAFWPLWAGVVPLDRVEALARHLKDPSSFWRHHPIPSLAADSPHFRPGGDYWRGSTWAPTNYAAIKGFDRAGRHDLAVETSLRHLSCIADAFEETGHFWENYSSEASTRGVWSGPDYCWTALGPISLLLEVVLGFEAGAMANTLRWRLPSESGAGVRRLAMGQTTVSAVCEDAPDGARKLNVESNRAFTLVVHPPKGKPQQFACPAGASTWMVE